MLDDPFDLERFVQAQADSYATALHELERGRKRTHWIWFILPQLRGLGTSAMSHTYGISGLEEARAYLDHPVLGPRLIRVVEALLQHSDASAEEILGTIDARKFHSCLTLFAAAAPDQPALSAALAQFFAGERDAATLERLGL